MNVTATSSLRHRLHFVTSQLQLHSKHCMAPYFYAFTVTCESISITIVAFFPLIICNAECILNSYFHPD